MAVHDGRVISNFVTQALTGTSLTLYGNGTQTRSFCYVDDMVDGLIRLMESRIQTPVNLGNPEEYTIRDIAKKVLSLTTSTSSIRRRPLPENDPQQRCPDIALAKRRLKWKPTTSLEVGLKKTIAYFRKRLSSSKNKSNETQKHENIKTKKH